MVTLSPVSTPVVNIGQNREQSSSVRDENASRDRLQTTRPAASSLSKTDTSSQKNFKEAQDFSDVRKQQPLLAEGQGGRRGSLIDLTV